jgi:hypothetical protein
MSYLDEWIEHVIANANATVLDAIPASSGTLNLKGGKEAVLNEVHRKTKQKWL